LPPDQSFEEGIHHAHENSGGHGLRPELGALCNTPGNDCGNRCGKGQQKKEMHQLVPLFVRNQSFCRLIKINSISNRITDQEIDDRTDRKVDDDFHQSVDLIFFSYRA
jgi:hypothetical protein